MNFSPHDLLTPDQIKADVLITIGDEAERTFNPGWYVSQIEQALTELEIDSMFNEVYKDFEVPESLSLKIPSGCFNLRNVFLFSGDCCEATNMKNVYWKRNYKLAKNSTYTANHKPGVTDPFINAISDDSNKYFMNVNNGYIELSSSCLGYDNIRLQFNGISTEIGAVPLIPRPFRQAIKSWVLCEAYSALRRFDERSYRTKYIDEYSKLFGNPYDSLWPVAVARAKSLDLKYRNDFKEYMSKMNY